MTKQTSQKKKEFSFCVTAICLYAALTLFAALRHELWFDEAQAWNIVRDNDWAGVIRELKFEGHPFLWYLILYPFAHLGFSCDVLPLISWAFCVAAAAIVLWQAPFGKLTRLVICFSSGFLYFNCVISRVYCVLVLALCLIAWYYPKRKEHPVLFGLWVAVLANTHIFVCGLVGALGLEMLWELWRDRKTCGARENVMRVLGLGTAGAGVVTLVLPLLGSLGANCFTSQNAYRPYDILYGIGAILSETTGNAVYADNYSLWMIPVGLLGDVCILLAVIFLRYWKPQFRMFLLFFVFYTLVCGVIWYMNPNRATVFLLVLAALWWMALTEGDPKESPVKMPIPPKVREQIPGLCRVADFLNPGKEAAKKTGTVLLTLLLGLTVPVGAVYLAMDIAQAFCPAKKAAEYIRQHYEADMLIVTDTDDGIELSAYLPEWRFYAQKYDDFYTYNGHGRDQHEERAGDWREQNAQGRALWLYKSYEEKQPEPAGDAVYEIYEGMRFGSNKNYIVIRELW